MDKKEENHGSLIKNFEMHQPHYADKTDQTSKKRKREPQNLSSSQAPGLPPKSSKWSRKRIKYPTYKMGGGCSFPASKNVIQPVMTKENGSSTDNGTKIKPKHDRAASPLSVMQLNFNGRRRSRKASLIERPAQSENTQVPLLLSYNSKENIIKPSPALEQKKQKECQTCSFSLGSSLCEDAIFDEKPLIGQEDTICQQSEKESMTRTYSSTLEQNDSTSSFRVGPTATHFQESWTAKDTKSSVSESSPHFRRARTRTSLSESDSVFVTEVNLRKSDTEVLVKRYNRTDAKTHDYTLRHCIGSADLINNCSRASSNLKAYHDIPRAATVSGATRERYLSASPRYRRDPTVENSVCYQEDDRINYYRILDEVGRGSYGSVYKCFSYKDKKHYAMKIISKKRIIRKTGLIARHPKKGKSNPLDALHREIAILKKVDHPNIVRLFEVIDDPEVDNVFMVFELMEKGPIIEIPTEEPLTEDKTRAYFRDIVLGIEYLHFSKIMHRDIKPSNLLLGDDGHVKIADFGVSDMFEDDDDMLNKFAGSPAFQSPEAITGCKDKYSGKAADIWALGITLFSCIYGKCPFYSTDVFELYEMIKSMDVVFPEEPTVDPQFQDLVSRMLAKDPKTRITIGDIKKHPWVTRGSSETLPPTEAHCVVIKVTEEEVKKSVKLISKLSSLILMKSMMRRRRLSVAKPQPQKYRSYSSPEFPTEGTQESSSGPETLAP